MNILVIHNFYKQYGGEDKAVEQQLDLLERDGHQVYLYKKDNSMLEESDKLHVIKNAYSSRDTWNQIDEIINSFRPDIAHVHNIYPIISPVVYSILHKRRIPIIQTVHNYRFICPNGLMFNKGRTCMACLKKDSYYRCVFNKCYRNSYLQSYWYANIISKAHKMGLFDKINTFIVLSDFTKDLMVEKGYNPEKIVKISNSIEAYGTKPQFEKQDYIVYIGRLSEEKGIMTLLKAMKELNSANLKIVGDGDLKKEVLEFIKGKNLQNVEVLGFKDGKEKEELISYAKAVIVPSECYENLPTVVMEAYSLGTPVIASRIGGLQYMVDDNVNGLRFTPNDYIDLKEKIEFILKNKSIAFEMSKNSFKTYLENYMPDIQYEKLINLYISVINKYTY